MIELAFAYQFSYPDEADGITIPVMLIPTCDQVETNESSLGLSPRSQPAELVIAQAQAGAD